MSDIVKDYMTEAERLVSEVASHYDPDTKAHGLYMNHGMKVQIAQVYATLSMTAALLAEGDEDEVEAVEFGTPPSGGEDHPLPEPLPEEMRSAEEITLAEFIEEVALDVRTSATIVTGTQMEQLRAVARGAIAAHVEQAWGRG